MIAKSVPADRLRAETDVVVKAILETKPLARAVIKQIVNSNLPAFDGRSLQTTMLSSQTRDGTRGFSR